MLFGDPRDELTATGRNHANASFFKWVVALTNRVGREIDYRFPLGDELVLLLPPPRMFDRRLQNSRVHDVNMV